MTGGGGMKTILPVKLRSILENSWMDWNNLREIRMCSNQPVFLMIGQEEMVVDRVLGISSSTHLPYIISSEDIQECMAYICQYSLYAYEDQIQKGFITIRGGHRVGMSGQVVIKDGKVHTMYPVSALNIRVAHSVKGCAESLFPYLWENNIPCDTLIVSPPGFGKTTLIRDLIRLFSDGYGGKKGQRVSLIDERSEIAACYQGIAQNDVGKRTDIMDHCPKSIGVEMMVRSMSPRLIAFDELGDSKDMDAVGYATQSGCRVLTTMHGNDWKDIKKRVPENIFQRYVFLNSWNEKERIREVLDAEGQVLNR